MFSNKYCVAFAGIVLAMPFGTVAPAMAENIDSGYQTLQGTQVFTTIYHDRGYATFENECGKQRLTQRQLQQGAIPSDIVPCPRSSSNNTTIPNQRSGGKLLWGALAAGMDRGLFRATVSVGSALKYASKSDAERAAVQQCRKNGTSDCKVVSTFTGCGYITTSNNAENVAWGAGPTAQAAYDNCYARVQGGNCRTQAIGGCN
jgi:hypothetical protein